MRNGKQKQTESDINLKLIWEQLLNSNPGPDNAQLGHLVIRSEPLAEKAMQQLLKQHPTNHELYLIMRDAKTAFKNMAFERLVQGKYAYKRVVSTVVKIPELRDIAWKKFIELGPGGDELRLIAGNIESLHDECWKIILTQQISNHELIQLIQDNEALREMAWKKLMQRDYTNRELCQIIEHCKEMRQKAWGALMKAGATNGELRYLIDHVPAIRKIADYKLFKETDEVMGILNGLL